MFLIFQYYLNFYFPFRLCYVAAREDHLPESLSYIHVTRYTPAPAVFLQGILAGLILLVGDIAALIEFASFLIWFFYGCAMVALLGEQNSLTDNKNS